MTMSKLDNLFKILGTIGLGFLSIFLLADNKNVEGLILILIASVNSLKYEVRELMKKYEQEKWSKYLS